MAAYIGNKRFQLTTALNGLGGPAKWGDITGQISAQADLQKEFQEVSALIMTEGIQQLNGIVKNGKMTIYQGNVEKGQFSANQSSDLSIFLDPPSPGGGGDIPADLSCNNLSVGTGVSLGLGCTASGEYGSIAQGALSKATANAAVALGSQCSAAAQMSYAIGYMAEASHQRSMVLALTDADDARQSKRDNSLNIYVGKGYYDDALTCVNINNTSLLDIIRIESASFDAKPYYISDSTQTGSRIQVGGTYSQWNKGIFCFEVESTNGYPIKYQFKDVLTENLVEFEYHLGPVTNTGYAEKCGAVITVPCVLDSGVIVYNDQGYDMTVRELYRIEFKDFYN